MRRGMALGHGPAAQTRAVAQSPDTHKVLSRLCATAPKALARQGFGRALATALARKALAIHCHGIALQKRTWQAHRRWVHSMDPPFPSLTPPGRAILPEHWFSAAKVGLRGPKCTLAYAQDERAHAADSPLGGRGSQPWGSRVALER